MIKKLILSTLIVIGFTTITVAQRSTITSKFRMSLNGVMGTESGFGKNVIDPSIGGGINLGAEYVFHRNFSGAASYTYFFTGSDVVESYIALNIDARYYFNSEKADTKAYLLLGYAKIWSKVTDVSNSEAGLNLGMGINHALNKDWGVNVQAKYQTPGEGQFVLSAGIIKSF
ncbi:MAG: porin family protein [Reichenbachiella sp.]